MQRGNNMDIRQWQGAEIIARLEELVTEVLREANENGEVLGPTEICRRTGIFMEDANRYYADWVGSGILNLLESKGQVIRLPQGKRKLIGD